MESWVAFEMDPKTGLQIKGTRACPSPTTENTLPISSPETSLVHWDLMVTVITELNWRAAERYMAQLGVSTAIRV